MAVVLNWLWQGGVIAAAVWLMLFALERSRANVRAAVCWAALLLIVLLPVLPWLQWTMPADAFGASQGNAVVSLPRTWWTSVPVVLCAWFSWMAVHAARFLSAIVAMRRARADARAFPPDVEALLPHWNRVCRAGRRATLVVSESVTAAAVLGWGKPVIATAPSLVRTLDADDLDRVLIHEWSHVQRRDDLVNLLQIFVRAVAGWHPAVWWIDRRLQLEREIGCDEMTLAVTGAPKSYANCLLKITSLRPTPERLRIASAVLARSGLRARVLRIVSPQRTIAPASSRTIAGTIVATLCLVSAALGNLNLVETSALALPSIAARSLAATVEHFHVAGAPVVPSTLNADSSSRQVPRVAQPPRPPGDDRPASPEAAHERTTPPASTRVDSLPAPQPGADQLLGTSIATAPPYSPPPRQVAQDPLKTPWAAAAAGGTALGRTSKNAGVATAGFFTRFARRVAGGSQ
jgi:beta-lactamase regulating signal transducer with metallopeptidase domain